MPVREALRNKYQSISSMKAAVVFALVAGVAAIAPACTIPAKYTVTSGGDCVGPATGYEVSGVCTPGFDSRFVDTDAADIVNSPLTDDTAVNFNADAGVTVDGCIVPTPAFGWGDDTLVTAGPLDSNCGVAGGLGGNLNSAAGIINPLAANNGNFKGVNIQCADGFFATQGTEGVNLCYPGTPLSINDAASIFSPAPVDGEPYFTAGSAQAMTDAAANVPMFTGDNSLTCSPVCTFPTTMCNDVTGFNSNLIVAGAGLNGCTLNPNGPLLTTNVQLTCASLNSAVFDIECVDGVLNMNGFTNQCGGLSGAQSRPVFDYDENILDSDLPVAGAQVDQAAGDIENYPLVTSVLTLAYTTANAQTTIGHHRYWNNNPAQAFRNGNVYDIAVIGCDVLATQELIATCVQQTLNWWRCDSDFPFLGAECYAAGTAIPCPAHSLGFRCESSSSKKGLWGLLGLLGIIPLCCLLCCCLLLCCIRRKKTEADVHFATFDPLGAPAVATAVVPTHCDVPVTCAPSQVCY